MKITKLLATNYRNLENTNIGLDEYCNFIVGENNLGKSNLLDLFQIIFSNRSFVQTDFMDVSVGISIKFTIKLDDIEIGNFEDLCDGKNPNYINIVCRQETVDDNIEFQHKETEIYIPASRIRAANFIHYNSLRNPIQEVKFGKSKGVGRFLNNIIQRYLKDNSLTNSDFLNEDKINELLVFVNENITKIKTFNDFDISAVSDNELESLLPKMLVFEDGNNNPLSQSGYGIQFLILITLSILEKVENIINKQVANTIFETSDEKKYISLIIGLDEPEVHLHPYMQRSLIKYLNKVIANENSEFRILLKDLFNIDGFIGQIILVTHSPNILSNNYKQIIRFYKDNQQTKIISGSSFELNAQESKHLHILFTFIKESFFSRGVILVEGDSEYGSFPYFANKLGYEFDDLGVCLIQTGGDGGIPPSINILNKFLIPVVAIRDRDNYAGTHTEPTYFTDKRDFEEEIIEANIVNDIDFLKTVVLEYDNLGIDRKLDKNSINKRLFTKSGNPKYTNITMQITNDLYLRDCANIDSFRYFYLPWYSINKGILSGAIIGGKIKKENIPHIYKIVIEKIIELL
jgi:putative ATP-dependent endonuclease of OLD family